MVLLHGTSDHVVPESSSDKFCAALQEMGGASGTYIKVPSCGHIDICLDMMDPTRPFYSVLEVIHREAQLHL